MTLDIIMMGSIYILAGVTHFIYPKPFLHIMPRWVIMPKFVNLAVGLIEIGLGAAFLYEHTRPYAAWGIILLLIAVFPANINHFSISLKKNKHVLLTALRLPLQFGLIYWAYLYT